jgi:two-component system KDP operon response regulator KdpE
MGMPLFGVAGKPGRIDVAGGDDLHIFKLPIAVHMALVIDFDKRKVMMDGIEAHLTPNEYKMLALMARNAGRVLTHSYFVKELWGVAMEKDANSIRVFMTGIRHKLENDPSHPRYLKAEIGVEYRLADE